MVPVTSIADWGTPYKNSFYNSLSRLMCPGHHSHGSLRGRPHPSEVTALASCHFPTPKPQHASPCPPSPQPNAGATPCSGAHGALILSINGTPNNVNTLNTNSYQCQWSILITHHVSYGAGWDSGGHSCPQEILVLGGGGTRDKAVLGKEGVCLGA